MKLSKIHLSNNPVVNDILISAAVITLATLLSLALYDIGLRVENILMIYAVSILIIMTETQKLLWGALSAMICMLLFNFFFTEPRYTLIMDDANYYASLTIFLVAAFLVSTLTTKLKKQVQISQKNEEMTSRLYKMTSGYLNLSTTDDLVRHSQKCIFELTARKCRIYLADEIDISSDEGVRWCYSNSLACGFSEIHLRRREKRWLPIKSNHKTIGVLELEMEGTELSKEEKLSLDTAISQAALALEHCLMRHAEEENRLEMEKEKFRNNLLRSISHDIRTPLTSIAGNASFLLESIDNIETSSAKSLLSDIERDASWLTDMVTNLLNLTKIQDGKAPIEKKNEIVDDIIEAAVEHVRKRLGAHTLTVDKPRNIMIVPMEGQLIIQTLVNLLDNAVKHTQPDSAITLRVLSKGKMALFEVIDNGAGISKDEQGKIFDNFVTGSGSTGDTTRGTGLGLAIAKSIVEAHGGMITVKNAPSGGALFTFAIPMGAAKNE